MAIEQKWSVVVPKAFVADGTSFGLITLADSSGFKVKQVAYLIDSLGKSLPVQVKRVLSPTQLIVGTINNAQIGQWPPLNISGFTVANAAQIGAQEQPKSNIKPDDIEVATYEADPTVARRVVFVDQYGQFYTDQNPIPINFEGSITIGAVEVKGTNGNFLEPNTDGSINVNVVSSPVVGHLVKNIYSEANSVVSGSTTTVVQYTVPLGVTSSILERISVAGENIAKWTVFWNLTLIDTRRTFYGSLNEYFEFTTGSNEGFVLSPGDTITVKVIHNKPYVSDFEGRIQVLEIT